MTNLTEQWVNIYKSKRLGGYWSGAFCYKTKRAAIKNLADKEHYLTTVNIEDVLNLQAENDKLKELLKECELWFTGVVGNMNDKNVGEHNRNLPIGNFEHAFKVFSQKINQVLGEE